MDMDVMDTVLHSSQPHSLTAELWGCARRNSTAAAQIMDLSSSHRQVRNFPAVVVVGYLG